MDVGEETLPHALATPLRVVDLDVGDVDVDKERRGVGQVAKTGVVGHHWQNCAVVFKDRRLLELRIAELEVDLVLPIDGNDGADDDFLLATHQGIRRRR